MFDSATYRGLRFFAADFIDFAPRRGMRAAVCIVLAAGLENISIVLLAPLLTLVVRHQGRSGQFVTKLSSWFGFLTVQSELAALLVVFCLLLLARGIAIRQRDNLLSSLQIGFVEDLRSRIVGRLVGAPWQEVMCLRHAHVLNVLGQGLQRVYQLSTYLLQSVTSLSMLAIQLAFIFFLSLPLALLACSLIVVIALILQPMLSRAASMGRFVANRNLFLFEASSQFLGGLKVAVCEDRQGAFVTEFRNAQRTLAQRQIAYFSQQSLGRTLFTTAAGLVAAALVWVGYVVLHLDPGIMIVFLIVVARMIGPAVQLQQEFQLLAFGLPAYDEAVMLLNNLSCQKKTVVSNPTVMPEGIIRFSQVSYLHGTQPKCGVENIDLEIAPGSFTGICGSSGSGKTTLADLLVGLLTPQSGHITIGGQVIDASSAAGWRAQLSYVSQDPFLFHGSIRRNLQWARQGAGDVDIHHALAQVGAATIVSKTPAGLDTVIGERGSLLSGGERQRIALAGALLRQPRLLILDEATNALDIAGERLLLERLRQGYPAMTIVLIAHRPQSLVFCDKILRLEKGCLSEGPPSATA